MRRERKTINGNSPLVETDAATYRELRIEALTVAPLALYSGAQER